MCIRDSIRLGVNLLWGSDSEDEEELSVQEDADFRESLNDFFAEDYNDDYDYNEDHNDPEGNASKPAFIWRSARSQNDLPEFETHRFRGPRMSKWCNRPLASLKELDMFFMFLPEEFWKTVVQYSNEGKLEGDKFEFTYSKLLRFLSFVILKRISGAERVADIWSKEPYYRNDFIAEILSYRDFWSISRLLRINRKITEPHEDKLYKIRPMVTELNRNSSSLFKLERYVSLDEASPGYSGRTSLKKRTKHKKVPEAFQFFTLCDSRTGYCFQFEAAFDNIAAKSNENQFSKTQNAVLRLIGSLEQNWHVVVMDNYYSSPTLCSELLNRKQLVLGTWRSSYGVPKCLDLPKLQGKSLETARNQEIVVAYCNEIRVNGESNMIDVIVGATLYDSSLVKFISTDKFTFWEKEIGGQKKVERYAIQHAYNSGMNGVDILDQLVDVYSTYIKSNKWWKRLFYWLLDVALVNSYIVMKESNYSLTHRKLLANVALQSLEKAVELEKVDIQTSPEQPTIEIPKKSIWRLTEKNQNNSVRLLGNHVVELVGKRHRCALCYFHKKDIYATTYCDTCKKYLCLHPCWNIFHSNDRLIKIK